MATAAPSYMTIRGKRHQIDPSVDFGAPKADTFLKTEGGLQEHPRYTAEEMRHMSYPNRKVRIAQTSDFHRTMALGSSIVLYIQTLNRLSGDVVELLRLQRGALGEEQTSFLKELITRLNYTILVFQDIDLRFSAGLPEDLDFGIEMAEIGTHFLKIESKLPREEVFDRLMQINLILQDMVQRYYRYQEPAVGPSLVQQLVAMFSDLFRRQ